MKIVIEASVIGKRISWPAVLGAMVNYLVNFHKFVFSFRLPTTHRKSYYVWMIADIAIMALPGHGWRNPFFKAYPATIHEAP